MPLPESIALLRQSYIPLPDNHFEIPTATSTPPADDDDPTPPLYPVTAIGGTFDHLHAGHKILLSMAAWITGQKLIIGITGIDIFTIIMSTLFTPPRRRPARIQSQQTHPRTHRHAYATCMRLSQILQTTDLHRCRSYHRRVRTDGCRTKYSSSCRQQRDYGWSRC